MYPNCAVFLFLKVLKTSNLASDMLQTTPSTVLESSIETKGADTDHIAGFKDQVGAVCKNEGHPNLSSDLLESTATRLRAASKEDVLRSTRRYFSYPRIYTSNDLTCSYID